MKKAIIITLLGTLAAVAAIYWTAHSSDRPVRDDAASADMPAFELVDVNGDPLSSERLRGKVLIVDIWATWCAPCRMEIPGFVQLQEKYGPKGLQIVGLSVDDGPEVVREFMSEMKMNYPVAMATRDLIGAFGGAPAIPTTFVVDRQGRIVKKHVGYVDSGTFEEEIASLL